MDRKTMTISAWRQQLQNGDISSRELVDQHINRLETAEPSLSVYNEITVDRARADADRIDAARAAGESLGPLAGLPLAIKDNLCTRGVRTTCSSRMLEHFVPPYESTATERLWQPEGFWLVKPTSMNLRWVARLKPRRLVRRTIRGISTTSQAVALVEVRRRLPPAVVLRRWGLIPADRSVSQRPSAVLLA